jgi:hypothetical protein
MIRMISEGGVMMFAIIGMVPFVLGAGVVHAVLARRATLVVGLVLLLAPLVAGTAGTLLGRARTDQAASAAADDVREMLRSQGYAEAACNLQLGSRAVAAGDAAAAATPRCAPGGARPPR